MKKAFLCLLFLVLLAGILTGCCSHEFAPADCEHPETCQKCGEVQGEALGHDWLDATCEAAQTCIRCGKTLGNPLSHDWLDATCDIPQTCARCAATQGEPLGHDFGSWTFTDTTMTHTCRRCDMEDTQELDRSVQLGSYLAGHWDFDTIDTDDQSISAYYFKQPPFLMDFQEDRTLSGILDGESITGTWEYQDYREKEEYDYFVFALHSSNDKTITCLYYPQEFPFIQLMYKNGDAILNRNYGMGEKLAGTAWKSDSPEGYSLILHEDYTFTAASPEETITGNWMTRPFRQYVDGRLSDSIYLWYEQDGEILSMDNSIRPETVGETDRNHFTPYQVGIQFQDTRVYLNATTELDILEQQKVRDENAKALVGTWSSISFHSDSGPNERTVYTDALGDYSISFYADGTFSGSVGREITGTWEATGEFRYSFYIHEDQTYHSGRLVYHGTHYWFDLLEIEGNSMTPSLSLIHFSKENIPDICSSIPGSYTSTQKGEYSKEEEKYIHTDTTAYTMTFHADGTFSGQLDIPVSGTWAPYSFGKDSMDTYYRYAADYNCRLWLNFDQEDFHSTCDFDSEGNFSIYYLLGTEEGVVYIFGQP